jgi:hypothetical protein
MQVSILLKIASSVPVVPLQPAQCIELSSESGCGGHLS